ncbi:hypothetical protein M407DRAFT_168338 [Tulasnella calospora MUT 4182]|uniref:Uncharacterized protein n=1 Tax=Tulasnella calospora MUT 4182 TaxID=1051891 RepID=A0A0C3L6K2_9AGAM|nr:hypothetical protein M407DRAFT_168338 [Tulasnella calospora MUT 4182]
MYLGLVQLTGGHMPRARANRHQIRLNNPALNGVVPPKNLRPMGTVRTDTHATVSLYEFSFFSFFSISHLNGHGSVRRYSRTSFRRPDPQAVKTKNKKIR